MSKRWCPECNAWTDHGWKKHRDSRYARHKVTIPIRFPKPVHAQLKEAAEERDLSMNYLVNHAVREYLAKP